ncbi:MAG: hypothetical protein FJ173_00980 [Gammaproteobacteria bacterium]|nr:hypothetical protein [Gammaproteobacteria bacterium]
MLNLPDHPISDRHARGLRRNLERRIRDRRARYKPVRRPQKFGPRVRMVHEFLFDTLGHSRVIMIEGTRKFAMWGYCELNEYCVYQLHGHALRKHADGVWSERYDFPLLATPHFFDRIIQGLRFEGHTLITTMIDVVRLLIDQVGIDESAPLDQWPTWQHSSSAWFALDYGLAAGDIPNHGGVVLRTIIPTAGLHPDRREDWEAMRAAGQHVSISRLSPS